MGKTTTAPVRDIRHGRGAVWLTFMVALAATAGFFAYGWSLYPGLPDMIVTHWGADGAPDGWQAKSVGSVFFTQFLAAGMTVFLAGVAAVAVRTFPPRPEATAWELHRREGTARGAIAALGLTSLVLAATLGLQGAMGWTGPDRITAPPALLSIPLILLVVIVSQAAAARWTARAAAKAGAAPTAKEAAEDRLWISGIFYNNPEDPRLMVPRRDGTGHGHTVNLGNRAGRIGAICFVALVVLVPLALAVLAWQG